MLHDSYSRILRDIGGENVFRFPLQKYLQKLMIFKSGRYVGWEKH